MRAAAEYDELAALSPSAELSGEAKTMYLAVRCCKDITDYFFTQPDRGIQPFFLCREKGLEFSI